MPALFGLAMVGGLAGLRVADPYPLQLARDASFDQFQRWKPRQPGDPPVRVVAIDEASLASLGQWPWPRDRLAKLTRRLGEMGAAAVGFDLLFPEADRVSPRRLEAEATALAGSGTALADYDAEFATALKTVPSALAFSVTAQSGTISEPPKAGFAISGGDPTPAIAPMVGAVMPLNVLAGAAAGLGGISLHGGDNPGIVRRLPLVWSGGDALYPSLSLETLRLALGLKSIVVMADSGNQGFVQTIRLGDIAIPTTASGDLTLYYAKPQPTHFISAREILEPNYMAKADKVRGRIILVGTTASGLLDQRATPLGDNVPGVAIHAQAIAQMVSGQFLTRADWVSGLEIISFVVMGMAVVFAILASGPLIGLVFAALMLAVSGGFSWEMFARYGVLMDPSFTLMGLFITYAGMVFFRFLITDADKRRIHAAFSHYVDPKLLARIERQGTALKLGGEMREVTVLFTDMRNFTSASEHLDPPDLLGLLNTLFGALGAEITARFGTIDKFVGDAIMAFWNAPVDVPEHALKATHAALAMREKLAQLNASAAFGPKVYAQMGSEVAVGIGLSTGPALVGNMGLETRFDYSCLGDTVNIASRLETASKAIGYDIVVAETVRAQAPTLAYLAAGSVTVKGRNEKIAVHILVGDETMAARPGFIELKNVHDATILALKRGENPDAAIAHCVEIGAEIEPGLTRFYKLIPGRGADFT